MPTLSNFSLGNYTLGGLTDGMMKYATGEVLSNASTNTFNNTSGTFSAYALLVTGLAFRPTRIIIRSKTSNNVGMIVYNRDTRGVTPDSGGGNYNLATYINNNNGTGYIVQVYEITGGSFNQMGQVTDTGFRLPGNQPSHTYVWEAWG